MIRVLFIILSIVTGLLAILLQQPLLYILAGAFLVVAAILVIAQLRKRHQQYIKAQQSRNTLEAPPEEELSSLGIMEIRPKSMQNQNGIPETAIDKMGEKEAADQAPAPDISPDSDAYEPLQSTDDIEQQGVIDELPVSDRTPSLFSMRSVEAKPTVGSPFYKKILRPYLQALRATLQAHTACLIKEEDVALHYQIVTLFSEYTDIRRSGTFVTPVPLLNPSETKKSVTVRSIGDAELGLDNLGYYRKPPEVKQVAFAPVRPSDNPTVFFLLVDTLQHEGLENPRQRSLLAQYAQLLSRIIEQPDDEKSTGQEHEIRPRRDIIAEEMERARANEQPLALALVYLNQTEYLADDDLQIVEADEALKNRLQASIRNSDRMEQFGQLTYGIFYHGDTIAVEAWAVSLQEAMAQEGGCLEEGVSIGIAVLHERHDNADAFRNDAKTALHESYKTGTCTILD